MNGWALDTDLATVRASLWNIPWIQITEQPDEADVIHSVWDVALARLPPELLVGKRVICHVCTDIHQFLQDVQTVRLREHVGLWVAPTRLAEETLRRLGVRCAYVPYALPPHVFTESPPGGITKEELRRQLGLPERCFVASNFMRDSLGENLSMPKYEKAPEAFVATIECAVRQGVPVHVLLAGPRRHWIRQRLRLAGIPFTFVGKPEPGDDMRTNILGLSEINRLYHASDLHLVSSRSEGGPRAILEAAVTRTLVLSTPVPLAADVLDARCIYRDVAEGGEKISSVAQSAALEETLDIHAAKAREFHSIEASAKRFESIYGKVGALPVWNENIFRTQPAILVAPRFKTLDLARRIGRRLLGRPTKRPGKGLTLSFWHEFHRPPYGGGNQFMLALRDAMERLGARIVVNSTSPQVQVHLCNSAWFDTKQLDHLGPERLVLIHRIDGPVGLVRGSDFAEDDRIFNLNRDYATATVFQSAWSLLRTRELGYQPSHAMVIRNAADPRFFYPPRGNRRLIHRKIRLISTSWSDNPRKGAEVFKWLDSHLDFDRYDYTFAGRVQVSFHNIHHVPPLSSAALGHLLRRHDVYINASRCDPCSNALLEALACGLPCLYMDDGGNPELVQLGGLPFLTCDEAPRQLEYLTDNYAAFRDCVHGGSMNDAASRYLDLAQRAMDGEIRKGYA